MSMKEKQPELKHPVSFVHDRHICPVLPLTGSPWASTASSMFAHQGYENHQGRVLTAD